ncbi:MAG: hypothetical protein MJ252_07890, partial [archaeon]|nr:hypothetical protein [archaeon]
MKQKNKIKLIDYKDSDKEFESILNSVAIESHIKNKHELKILNAGVDCSFTEDTYLYMKTIWSKNPPPKNYILVDTTNSEKYTAQLFINTEPDPNKYILLIYENKIDRQSVSFKLELFKSVELDITPSKPGKNGIQSCKIFIASERFIIINDIHKSINVVSFLKDKVTMRVLYDNCEDYNQKVIDVIEVINEEIPQSIYPDEKYKSYIIIKETDDDSSMYGFFMLSQTIYDLKSFTFHNFSFKTDDWKGVSFKVAKIKYSRQRNAPFYYIFVIMTYECLYILVSDWNRLPLLFALKQIYLGNEEEKFRVDYNPENESEESKEEKQKGEKENKKINQFNKDKDILKFYVKKYKFDVQGTPTDQVKLFINKNLNCSLLIYHNGYCAYVDFFYNESPSETKDKLFLFGLWENVLKECINPNSNEEKFKPIPPPPMFFLKKEDKDKLTPDEFIKYKLHKNSHKSIEQMETDNLKLFCFHNVDCSKLKKAEQKFFREA